MVILYIWVLYIWVGKIWMVKIIRWKKVVASCLWWEGMSTSVNLEVVDAVVMTVGDIVVILSVSIIEVAETMVRKDVGKNEAVAVGEIAPAIFCCNKYILGHYIYFLQCVTKFTFYFSITEVTFSRCFLW